MFKDADCKTVPWEWRINLSLSNLSQELHPAFVLTKASLGLIVFWENGTEWYKIISHPPQAQLHVNLYSLMAIHKNSVVSFLQPVPSIMDKGLESIIPHLPLLCFGCGICSILWHYSFPLLALEGLGCSPAQGWKIFCTTTKIFCTRCQSYRILGAAQYVGIWWESSCFEHSKIILTGEPDWTAKAKILRVLGHDIIITLNYEWLSLTLMPVGPKLQSRTPMVLRAEWNYSNWPKKSP